MRIDELASATAHTVHIDASELRPDTGDVTRCSCGPDYTPRESVRLAIEQLIPTVLADVDPRFAYAVFRVAAREGEGIELTDSRIVELKLDPEEPLPAALAAVICTVGAVDERLEGMIESHGPLDAWIAQGIAMAQLERLEQRAMRHVLDLARAAGLQATTYMEPDVATRSQQDLFDSVDAAALGVRLTEYGTMEPRLSYSFWLPLYPGTHDSQSGA
jgi:hypothetical protein